MTTGASGTYSVNGTNLSLPPTSGKWMPRDTLGMDGNGHPIYSSIREFELRWVLSSISDAQQVINFYNLVINTGTLSIDLPEWGANQYQFRTYSGVTLEEPQVSEYFTEYLTDISLVVKNIRT